MSAPQYCPKMFRDLADQIEAGDVDAFVCYADTPKGLLVLGNNCQGIGASCPAGIVARNWRERLALALAMLRHGAWPTPVRLDGWP